MYRASRKVDVTVADVVLEVVKQGVHKKVAEDTEEPKTDLIPVAAPSAISSPDISIADIVLNTKTYTALHEASQGHPDMPSSDNRSHTVGSRAAHTPVRTSPPGKSRSISPDISATKSKPSNKTKKGDHMSGFMNMIRTLTKGFDSKLRKSLFPWRKQS
ncbi:hypothetical protein E1B28_010474 [Marasmius oreades]|uniref:Uncharacterized protein n=1 Tax=Marasmius oreades TaxID=181124 RepID=A0A9P7RYN5_9AGAR|nr:uncharacterized protein E1B28_010474 [Marasmius oreades]KAG7091438.1 hypothetical protein E1B28_010474 [Marasmius oreades]